MASGDHNCDTGHQHLSFRPKLLLSLIIMYLMTVQTHCLHNDTGKRPFSEAKGCCQSYGTTLCSILSVHPPAWPWKPDEISTSEPIWVDLERKRFSSWEWLDQSPYSDENLDGRLGNSVYGQLDLTNERIVSAPASRTPAGMICEHKDCSGCGARANMAINCVHVGPSCYVFRCGVRNWYSARATCVQQGSDLAIIKDQILVKLLSQQGPTSGDDCKYFWLGLRKEKWTFGTTENEFINWAPEQPGELGDCAVMVKGEFDNELKAANCTDSYDFLCQDDETGKLYANRNCELLENTDPLNASQTDNFSNGTPVLLVILGCLSGLFLLALIIMTILYRKARKKRDYEEAATELT